MAHTEIFVNLNIPDMVVLVQNAVPRSQGPNLNVQRIRIGGHVTDVHIFKALGSLVNGFDSVMLGIRFTELLLRSRGLGAGTRRWLGFFQDVLLVRGSRAHA